MPNALAIIPTYNEADNIQRLVKALLELPLELEVLVVDDGSPDGTGEIADALASEDNRVHVIHREGKLGLGTAYKAGLDAAAEGGFEFAITMDADFSHDPAEIPALLEAAGSADLIIGSRYVDGIRITNWPLSRLLLSKMAATYVRLITGIPVADPTSGFRCYRREVLQAVNLDAILSNGYSFLVETAHTTWMLGFRIREIPITFVDRRSGYSKMTLNIFRESLWIVWKLAFRYRLRRRPLAGRRRE